MELELSLIKTAVIIFERVQFVIDALIKNVQPHYMGWIVYFKYTIKSIINQIKALASVGMLAPSASLSLCIQEMPLACV